MQKIRSYFEVSLTFLLQYDTVGSTQETQPHFLSCCNCSTYPHTRAVAYFQATGDPEKLMRLLEHILVVAGGVGGNVVSMQPPSRRIPQRIPKPKQPGTNNLLIEKLHSSTSNAHMQNAGYSSRKTVL